MNSGSHEPNMSEATPIDLERTVKLLSAQNYIADRDVALSISLASALDKPLLVEGPAGVGKTEIAKVMSESLSAPLIRLQCYEGLDATTALYEWNYQHQILHLKMHEQSGASIEEKEESVFGGRFLLKRPLLQAITSDVTPVLLIDELDRADEEFESFLLEVLSEWQITIPELGPVRATHVPRVVITSNRTRELSDAVRRRCLFLWIDFPSFEKELEIVRAKVKGVNARLGKQICRFMEILRQRKLEKAPGVSETLDWARALVALHRDHLDADLVKDTLGIILKERNDVDETRESLPEFFERMGIRSRLHGERGGD